MGRSDYQINPLNSLETVPLRPGGKVGVVKVISNLIQTCTTVNFYPPPPSPNIATSQNAGRCEIC